MALRLVAVAALYYAGAWIGLLQELVRDQVTPLWPPTGIALACLLTLGPTAWPGIALGAVAVNAPIGPSPLAVLAIVVGNTLAPICSYLLLRNATRRQIEHVCAQLAEAVFRLAPDEPGPPRGDRRSTDRR
ncbi:MASE1 domain-containing protein [Streptomyces violaceusniger]|uniref:MASE1 domain-containing protein n=1 Tax=Streptomyces violaceusniger TaxID=68280 RepID=UPI0037F4E329